MTSGAFGAFATTAPGSWIEIYGFNFATETRTWTSPDFDGIHAPTSLDGTRATIAGQPTFVSYISPNQVNVQILLDIPAGEQQVTLTTDDGSDTPSTSSRPIRSRSRRPPPGSHSGQYVGATFGDGTFVAPQGAIPGISSRPATPGESITLYGVGFGPVVPSMSAGEVASGLNDLQLPLQITIGGAAATAGYVGLAPGSVGLYQLNVVVPNIAAGDAVPVTFTLNGVDGAQTLYTAVQN